MIKIYDFFKNNWKIITFSLCIIIFAIITGLLLTDNVTKFDNFIYDIVIITKCDIVTYIYKFITFFSSTIFIIVSTVLIMLFIKNKKTGFYIALNALLCCLLNQGLKFIIARPRPTGINIIDESGFSFPSGHSMMSVAFFGLLIYFVSHKKYSKKKKIILSLLLSLLILLIGISRIYLGVHYASDVLAGFALSLAYLLIFIKYIMKKDN